MNYLVTDLETSLAAFHQGLWIVEMVSMETQSLLLSPSLKACLCKDQTRGQEVGEIQTREYKLTRQNNSQMATGELTHLGLQLCSEVSLLMLP